VDYVTSEEAKRVMEATAAGTAVYHVIWKPLSVGRCDNRRVDLGDEARDHRCRTIRAPDAAMFVSANAQTAVAGAGEKQPESGCQLRLRKLAGFNLRGCNIRHEFR
jgi:hypothetical protein